MSAFDNIISKVNILGGKVIGENDFSIAYKIGDSLGCTRIKPDGTIDKSLQNRNDITDIYISNYFTTVIFDDKTLIITKYVTDYEIISKVNMIIPGEYESEICTGITGNTPVFLYKASNNTTYVMNYKGNKFRVFLLDDSDKDGKVLTIIYMSYYDRYYVGYGWPKYKIAVNVSDITKIVNPSIKGDILMSFDKELKNVKYNINDKMFDNLV